MRQHASGFLPVRVPNHKLMTNNGLFFGLTTLDIVHYVPSFPGGNEKVKAERQKTFAGGPAANAAVAFAAFANPTRLVTGLGHHPLSQLAREELQNFDVKVMDYTDQPERPPIVASVIVDLTNGNRTVVYSNSDKRGLKQDYVIDALLEEVDIIMFDGHYMTEAVTVAQRAKEMEIPTVLDCGSWKEGQELLLPYIDYAVCSECFTVPGCSDHEQTITSLHKAGIERIAITRGAESIIAVDGSSRKKIPVMEIRPLDTLGAGDIFHGAFCHYILQDDFFTSLARAAEVAGLSCTSLGTRNWIEQEKFI